MSIPNQNRAFPIKRRKTEDTLVSWDSVTTANGNAGGISLIDSGLIGMNDFITDQVTVIILGGAANLERQLCTAFNPATGEVDFSALSAQIMAGTPYRLTGLMSPEVSVAGLAADLAVPLPNSANNVLMRDVVGNKTDTPVSTVGATASLMAYVKGILNNLVTNLYAAVIPQSNVSLAAIDSTLTTPPNVGPPDAENTIMDLAITAGQLYKIDDMVLKVSSFGTGTQITITLWELLGGSARANYAMTKTVVIPTDYPITDYLNLMDLFGKPSIVGAGVAITAVTDVGNTGVLECTYNYSVAKS